MLSFQQVLKVIIEILLPIISIAVYILQSSSSLLLRNQPGFKGDPGPLQRGWYLLDLPHSCSNSVILLSRASFPQHTPTLVYLDVAPLNIYAEIHYLSIKYLSAYEPVFRQYVFSSPGKV